MKNKLIIIGGGIAGLAAGVFGQMKGFDTEIYEMHTIPGGQCTAWKRKGYMFDYCIQWLMGSASGSINKLWRQLGALTDDVSIIEPEIFVRTVNSKSEEFLIYKDLKKWKEYLLNLAPEDEEAIERLFSIINKSSFSGDIEEFMKPKQIRRIIPLIMTLFRMTGMIGPMIKYGRKNFRQFIENLSFKNQFVKNFLTDMYSDENFSAFAFILMMSLFKEKNAGYPVGGSLSFIQRIVDRYQKLGGTLIAGKKVSKILVENSKASGIKLADGTSCKADYIIAACDLHTIIHDMLDGKYVPEDIENAFANWPLFNPLVQVSFGIDKKISEKQMMNNYLIPGTRIGSTEAESYSIMNYCYDPEMAPAGKTTIILRFEKKA